MGAASAMAMFFTNGVEAARSLITSVVASGVSMDSMPLPESWEPNTKPA